MNKFSRPIGLTLGYVIDAQFADPKNYHPVAGFGTIARHLEKRIWANNKFSGMQFSAALVSGSALVGGLLGSFGKRSATTDIFITALSTWAVLGSQSLHNEAAKISNQLRDDQLIAARHQLTHLVSRKTDELTETEIARATIESLAENTSDAVIAPLFWGALLGPLGLFSYRAINTLDAMVGYRNPRYAKFGWASAKFDDWANFFPARLTALSIVACANTGRRKTAWHIWRRDGHTHPSPNGGPIEAATAGALNLMLGGINNYDNIIEYRHTLGDGTTPLGADIISAQKLLTRVNILGLIATAALAIASQSIAQRLTLRCTE